MVSSSQESFLTIAGGALTIGRQLLQDKHGDVNLNKVFEFINKAEGSVNASLPSYVKRATVDSRVFMTKDAAQEECINDVLYADNSLYIGWITTALSMNQFVNGSRIRDILGVVATENYYGTRFTKSIDEVIDNIKVYPKTMGIIGNINKKISDLPDESEFIKDENGNIVTDDNGNPKKRSLIDSGGANQMEIKDSFNLLGGTIIEMSFVIGPKQVITIPILVRLSPTIINNQVAEQFFKVNFKPDLWTRWFKWRTGEISFWKDFLFELDIRNDRRKALKNDRTNEVFEMMSQRTNSLSAYIGKLVGWRSGRQNIASTIHIYTKRYFDMWCHDSGLDFRNFKSRQQFFEKSFTMIINVIDSDYNKVYTYINGINNYAELSFSQLQNNRSKQSYDLSQIMRAFSTQSAPRF